MDLTPNFWRTVTVDRAVMPFLERLITRLPAPLMRTLSFADRPFLSLKEVRPRARRLPRFAFFDVLTLPAVRSCSEPVASWVQETRIVTTPEPDIRAGEGEALQGLVL